MPVTRLEAQSVPDILDTSRGEIEFPNLPGGVSGDRFSFGGRALTIKNAMVAFPEKKIGHVRVPMYNNPRGFRGHKDTGNQFTASFYEDALGGTTSTLSAWMDWVCYGETDDSGFQADYSVDCLLTYYGPTGRPAVQYDLINVFPIGMNVPDANRESSQPAIIEATFSVDFKEKRKVSADAGATTPTRESVSPGMEVGNGYSRAMDSVRNSGIAGRVELGLGNTGVTLGAGFEVSIPLGRSLRLF